MKKTKDIILGLLRSNNFVIHPFMVTAFFILFLYAHNISEAATDQMFVLLGFFIIISVIIFFILKLILRSWAKTGLATTIFLCLFFLYGRFYDVAENWNIIIFEHKYLLPGLLLVFGYCVYFIKLSRKNFAVTTRVLNIISAILVVINIFNIVYFDLQKPVNNSVEAHLTGDMVHLKDHPEELPDIYHIVLDEYASLSTIKEYFGYDNDTFADSLRSKGFKVSKNSLTPITMTLYCLASILNVKNIIGNEKPDDIINMFQNNKISSIMKAMGYQNIYISPGNIKVNGVKQYFSYKSNPLVYISGEFASITFNTTMLQPFYMYMVNTQVSNLSRSAVTDSLELLKRMPESQEPKYILAHILCPHAPFVFGPNGENLPSEDFYNWSDRPVYLGQYIFITKEIEKTIDTILADSKRPVIIILQSDHGPRILENKEAQKIFNAIYLSDTVNNLKFDGLPPVDTYPFVFKSYFGVDLKIN